MKYEIKGGDFPVVVCTLEPGEKMITESGSMAWMSPNMEMETHGGGIGKMFSRVFAGENMFLNHYTAKNGPGLIAFASSFPGEIRALEIAPGREMIIQKKSFLASEAGVEVSLHVQQKALSGFFGGEGFVMQRLSGNGTAFLEIDGALMEYILKPGQSIVVNTGHVAAMDATVNMDVRKVSGVKNIFLGGEGLFNTVLTGPGRVWLQTMPLFNIANALRPYFPTNDKD